MYMKAQQHACFHVLLQLVLTFDPHWKRVHYPAWIGGWIPAGILLQALKEAPRKPVKALRTASLSAISA